MLKNLAERHQKEIALGFISLFFISGLNSLKAEVLNNQRNIYYNITSKSLRSSKSKNSFDKENTNEPEQTNNYPLKAAQYESSNHPMIGGPSQPEMNAFKSVGSDNMVSPFTGDFSYNIPLLDVGGYPINLFYNSGITMDQESSWVGLGWNINPGTITRNMRGIPDDFDGSDIIKKSQNFKDDKTWGVTTGADIKISGIPSVGLGIGLSGGISYNNKLGFAAEGGLHSSLSLGAKAGDNKTVNLSFSVGLNASSRAGASISPSVGLSIQNQAGQTGGVTGSIGVGYTYSSRMGLSSMHLDANANVGLIVNQTNADGASGEVLNSSVGGSFNSTLSFAYPSIMPSITKRFTKRSISLNTSIGLEYWWVNPTFKLGGYFSTTYLDKDDKVTYHPAYGMLNYQKANSDPDALLDFNRANDGMYTPSSPAIAMPVYTYDVFNITGEGTGGSFRAYRSDIGHMRDASVTTKEQQGSAGFDIGFGNIIHGGASMSYVYTPTSVGDWVTSNLTGSTFSFQDNAGLVQAAYFKNPGEKAIPDANFQDNIGNEDLVRLKLGNTNTPTPVLLSNLIRYDAGKNIIGEKPISENTRKTARDKRTQVISFLTAEESERIGINTKIYSYQSEGTPYENKVIFNSNCNRGALDSFYRNHQEEHTQILSASPPHFLGNETEVFRKKNHISQIDVLGADGRKYVYGLPVYNKKQVELTFSINKEDKWSDSKVLYQNDEPNPDNSINNRKGRDYILDKQEMPAYTHSFLLTELLSPNYVDVTGNGISEDDMGDAVKFNYSKARDFNWRTPVGDKTASYNEGLKTDEKDDKAHYIYGEREQWYLYSIESKNMVARFYVKSNRKDGKSVIDENGALDPDASHGMKRLDRISLYSKADLIKYPNNPRPVKTIRFFQTYKLCKNNAAQNELGSNSMPGLGKLTLDSIWITYNGNESRPKSHYVFYYPDDTNNPDYHFNYTDRWGTYKPVEDNPALSNGGNVSNQDYPYSLQNNKTNADKNAAAWTMNKIMLPSGAVIKIDYESDTYAYVQNKKAANMVGILGFGTSETTLPENEVLNKLYTDNVENNIIYFKLPFAIADKAEFAARYLEDIKQLYFKLAVEMPFGQGLSGLKGYENIGVYADFDINTTRFGLLPSRTDIAWINIPILYTGHTPMVQSVLQYLTQQLPGKAYKNYDVSDVDDGTAIVSALAGMIGSVKGLTNGEYNVLMADKKCQSVLLDQSFIKLTNPGRNKFGGGLRVKRIEISDNWTRMTKQLKATYGQEYNYTTTELINGKLETISSGVAAWEPSVGGDENPFREIKRYVDHNKGGPYDFGAIEMPLGEMFYPGASVGYSRVEVVSIHRDTVKNQPTRQVTEFYTNKDFPYKSSSTDLTGDAHSTYNPPKIMQLLKIDLRKNVTLSQGFLVETNDMNGKEKSHATFAASDPANPVSYTQNFYNTKEVTDKSYEFNHVFPTIANAEGVVTNALIGRDIELMTDFREHTTETVSVNVDMNFDLALWGYIPVPIGMVLAPVTKERTMYRSAAVLKIVTHYGMLDSVVVVDKGSMVSTKNLVYDAETGTPLLTRTQNEHNKPLYNFNYPAHWAYSGMGSAYKNIDATFNGLTFRHGILTQPPVGFFENVLESGDEIYTWIENNFVQQPHAPCDDPANNTIENYPWTTLNYSEANRIWAVNTSKSIDKLHPAWVFMDANGNPYNAVDAHIRIVRSGKRNLLDKSIGSLTSLNYPIDAVTHKLVFNTGTNILQTSAATYKDHWRVDNDFYQVRDHVDNSTYSRVHRMDISPEDFVMVQKDWRREPNCSENVGSGYENYLIEQNEYLDLTKYSKNKSELCKKIFPFSWYYTDMKETRKIGFLKYSYEFLPPNAITYKGLLSLYSHSNMYGEGSPIDHSGLHSNGNASNNFSMLGKVNAINSDWFGTVNNSTNAINWANSYINNNNVSFGLGIIPYPVSGYDNYANENKINVTLPLITKMNPILDNQKKIGLKISLWNDAVGQPSDAETFDYRCFCSPYSRIGEHEGKPVTPKLSYYYYICDNMDSQGDYADDPIVNSIVTCNSSTTTGLFCRSKFARKAVNPYVEGIFGNWRIDSTYAYYGKRKEADFNTSVDTRTGGAIDNYLSFWNFAVPASGQYLVRNFDAHNVWVWNSTITQYNRKGYEIENTDPLGRFNSGLYGYSQQLPIAVTNNSRVRETLFDGFEDYDYQLDPNLNCINCKPHRHFNYTEAIKDHIVNTQKHTGKNSLRVDKNESIIIKAPVTGITEADRPYGFELKATTVSNTNPSLASTGTPGTGLRANFYNHAVIGTPYIPLEPGISNVYPQSTLIFTKEPASIGVNYNDGTITPQTGVSPTYFSVKWEGFIQAPATGTFKFETDCDNGYRLRIGLPGTTTVSSQAAWTSSLNVINGYGNGSETERSFQMTAGTVYPIEVCFYNGAGLYLFNLRWKRPDRTAYEPINNTFLYVPGSVHYQDINTIQGLCDRLDNSQVKGNALTDSFSLLQDKKMLLSAWVKVGETNCCFPATYSNGTNNITVTYEGSSVYEPPFQPSGSIIEGWQRYESVFVVPINATGINISFKNLQTSNSAPPVFFDDIRILPFNSNMKSFVYNPSNLRLMAELDENNYASFYEYDDDGTLTRVKKETQRGIKTITETRSASQKNILIDN